MGRASSERENHFWKSETGPKESSLYLRVLHMLQKLKGSLHFCHTAEKDLFTERGRANGATKKGETTLSDGDLRRERGAGGINIFGDEKQTLCPVQIETDWRTI